LKSEQIPGTEEDEVRAGRPSAGPLVRRRLLAPILVAAALLGPGSAWAAAPAGPVAGAAQGAVNLPLPACVVPDLLGRTLPQIAYHGILGGHVDGDPTHNCAIGPTALRHPLRPAHGEPEVVVSQRPRAGTRVPYNTPVSLVLAPAPRPVKPGVCHLSAGTEAVLRTATLVIYRSYTETQDAAGIAGLKTTWHACRRPSGVRQTVFVGSASGESGGGVGAGNFAVGGLHVAHTVDSTESKYTGGSDYRRLVVFDLATRTTTFDYFIGETFGPGNDPPGAPPLPVVLSTVVNARGFVAWVTGYPTASFLYVHDSQGTRVLDTAAANGISGLWIGAGRLVWTANGTAKTAALG
jgi:hypothetical protein